MPTANRFWVPLALACAIGAVVVGVALAAETGVYTHIWAEQSMIGGDLGGVVRQWVDADEIRLDSADGGTWTGFLLYEDRLGVRDAAGTTRAQIGTIELVLDGADIEAGRTLGGTFSGTARVRLHEIDSPADAADDGTLGELESEADYELSGHWGAQWDGELLIGEILYESASRPDQPGEDARAEATRFNRLSGEDPDGLGDAQTFTIETGSPPPGDGAANGDEANGDAGDPGNGGGEPTAWEYVRRGFGGRDTEAMPSPEELNLAARALRDATPAGATPLPGGAASMWIEMSGPYLDAKNRAAGLLDDEGPTDAVPDQTDAWQTRREETVRPVAPADADLIDFYAQRLLDDLEGSELAGADSLRSEVELTLAGPGGADTAPALKTWADAAAAATGGSAVGDAATLSRDACERVIFEVLERTGPSADAVLVWARHETAPREAFDIEEFDEAASQDASASTEGDSLVARSLARHGIDGEPPGLAWGTTGGLRSTSPTGWPAFAAPDERVVWRAGDDGPVALTDGALRGWAFRIERAWLVEASHIGRIRAVLELE